MGPENKLKTCCICGCQFSGHGNTPDGAMWRNSDGEPESREFTSEERCCDGCNSKYVIPGRMFILGQKYFMNK